MEIMRGFIRKKVQNGINKMKNNLQTHTNQFLQYLSIEKNASPLTIREYKRYLREFSDWIERNYPDFTVEKLDMPTVRAFRIYLAEKQNKRGGKLARVSQNHYVICLRSFLKYLLKNDISTLEPTKIELPKENSRSPKFLSRSDAEKLLQMPDIKTAWGLRDRAILELFFSTGLRVSELFRLDRNKIDLIQREFSVLGKGSKERLVFLSEESVNWIKKYLEIRIDSFKPLFIRYSREIDSSNQGEKMRLSVSSIERMVKSYGKLAGITLNMTPHVLRHIFATDLMLNGADLRSVQEFLGHTNIATTQIYTHVTNNHLREQHRKFHRA